MKIESEGALLKKVLPPGPAPLCVSLNSRDCSIVVLKARLVSSSSGISSNSLAKTSVPHGPAYPVFSTHLMNPLRSKSPSPQNVLGSTASGGRLPILSLIASLTSTPNKHCSGARPTSSYEIPKFTMCQRSSTISQCFAPAPATIASESSSVRTMAAAIGSNAILVLCSAASAHNPANASISRGIGHFS